MINRSLYMVKKITSKDFLKQNKAIDFVGRTELLSELQINYNSIKNFDDYSIVNITGIGGIGKSFVSEKIIKDTFDKEETIFIHLNFDSELIHDHSMEMILFRLRQELVYHYNFSFENFDRHLNFLSKEKGVTIAEPLKQYKNDHNLIKHARSIGKAAYNIADSISYGLVSLSIEIVDDYLRKKEIVEIEAQCSNLADKKMIGLLNVKFIEDIRNNMTTAKWNQRKICIIVDTFEEFEGKLNWLFSDKKDNDFGYGLVHSLPKTLWIFSGRDTISLPEYSFIKQDNYFEHKVSKFNENEIKEFIQNNTSITEELLVSRLVSESEGYPLYLELLVKYLHTFEGHNQEKAVHDLFTENKDLKNDVIAKKIAERFKLYFDAGPNEGYDIKYGNLIRILIHMGRWEENDILSVSKYFKQHSLIELLDYDSIKKISTDSIFTKVSQTTDELYTIDRIIRKVILDVKDESFREKDEEIIRTLIDYYSNKSMEYELRQDELNNLIQKIVEINGELSEASLYALINEKLSTTQARLIANNHIRELIHLRLSILECLSKVFLSSAEGNELIISILQIKTLHLVNGFDRRIERLLDGIEEEPNLTLTLGHYYLKIGEIKYANEVLNRIEPKELDKRSYMTWINLKAEVTFTLSQFNETLAILSELDEHDLKLETYEAANTHMLYIDTYNELGISVAAAEHVALLINFIDNQSNKFPIEMIYPYFISLGVYYQNCEKYNEALCIYESIIKRIEMNRRNSNLSIPLATFYRLKGVLLKMNGQVKAAEKLLLKTQSMLEEYSAEESRLYLDTVISLAVIYIDVRDGNWLAENFISLDEKIVQQFMGEESIDTSSFYMNLGVAYMILNEYERAEQKMIKAYLLRKNILGSFHSRTLDSLLNVYIMREEQLISMFNKKEQTPNKIVAELVNLTIDVQNEINKIKNTLVESNNILKDWYERLDYLKGFYYQINNILANDDNDNFYTIRAAIAFSESSDDVQQAIQYLDQAINEAHLFLPPSHKLIEILHYTKEKFMKELEKN